MTRQYRAVIVAAFVCIDCTSAKPDNFADLPDAAGISDAPICEHALPPLRPLLAGDPGSIEFVVVMRDYDMGETDDADGAPKFLSIGYDLDGRCTGQGEGPTCIGREDAQARYDFPAGRDNAFGESVYEQRRGGRGNASEVPNMDAELGRYSGAIRVREYNGLSFDSNVEVAVYSVSRILDPALQPPKPSWDGTDVWHVLEPWLAPDAPAGKANDPNPPRYYDARAYVSDGVLVAHFDRIVLGLGFELSKAFLTARLVRAGETWLLLDGTFVGRLKTDSLFDLYNHALFCNDAPEYQYIKQRICDRVDINFEGSDDGSSSCNAWSWATRFQASSAQISGVVSLPALPTCPPATSPGEDNCEK